MTTPTICACLLAGGRGERLGGQDKGLVELDGQPLVAHCIARLQPQVNEIMISANRNTDRYATFGHRVITDPIDNYAGPLAGLLAVMQATTHPLILLAACDSPFLPPDLAARLTAALAGCDEAVAVVESGGRMQPVFACVPCSAEASLTDYLAAGGRKIMTWYSAIGFIPVPFADADAFANINTPADLEAARTRPYGDA